MLRKFVVNLNPGTWSDRKAGLSLTTIIVGRACSPSARDSSSTGELRVKTIRLDQSRDRTPRVVGRCVESTHTPF